MATTRAPKGQEQVATTPPPAIAKSAEPAAPSSTGVSGPIEGVAVDPPIIVDDLPGPERPTNVIQALARVMAELPGIEKLTPLQRAARGMIAAPEQGAPKYAYRGIDQLAGAAQPLLSKYGVVIVPLETKHEMLEFLRKTANGESVWSDWRATVRWAIYGPGGVEDVITAETVGNGHDNSDKGANKAQTGAFKNLLLRLLCIGDPADDPDMERHDRDDVVNAPPPDPSGKTPVQLTFEHVVEFGKKYKDLAPSLKEWASTQNKKLSESAFAEDENYRIGVEATMIRLVNEAHAAAAQAADHGPVEEPGEPESQEPEFVPGTTACPLCGGDEFEDLMSYEDHVAAHVESAMAEGEK